MKRSIIFICIRTIFVLHSNNIIFATMDIQEIRKNRQRIRKQMKGCFVIPSVKGVMPKTTIDIKKVQEQHLSKKRRRKTSEDVKVFDNFNYLKQIYISNSFSDLFQLGSKIGEGAQSTVYTCKQLCTGNTYAVKIIKNKDIQLTKTLKEQYRILKTIDNPNVIKAYYLFINQNQGTSHMVCQYFASPTLRQHMLAKQSFKETEIAEILAHVLNTLYELHKKGICHRDIKPENILYNAVTGQLKIIDFEISKMAKYGHQRVSMATPTGSLFYRAPQMFGGQYNEAVDIWAVGIIAYEMGFKQLPFWSDYAQKVIYKIQNQIPKYNQTLATPLFIRFVQKLLSKNPLQRPSACQALKTPFMLKYSSISTSSSPKLKKNGSQYDKQQRQRNKLENAFSFGLSKCYDEDSQVNGNDLSSDIGIRFCWKSLRNCQ